MALRERLVLAIRTWPLDTMRVERHIKESAVRDSPIANDDANTNTGGGAWLRDVL